MPCPIRPARPDLHDAGGCGPPDFRRRGPQLVRYARCREPGQAYEAEQPKTVVELQQFRTTNSIRVDLPDGTQAGVTLINLNPQINRWYLLRISPNGSTTQEDYHLENPFPDHQQVVIDEKSPDGLILTEDNAAHHCPLWKSFPSGALDAARRSQQVYAPLCDGKLYLRNPAKGHRTAIEAVTDFLRDKLPGGEAIVGFVRDTFFKDAYREQARTMSGSAPKAETPPPDSPSAAMIDPGYTDRLMEPVDWVFNWKERPQACLPADGMPSRTTRASL